MVEFNEETREAAKLKLRKSFTYGRTEEASIPWRRNRTSLSNAVMSLQHQSDSKLKVWETIIEILTARFSVESYPRCLLPAVLNRASRFPCCSSTYNRLFFIQIQSNHSKHNGARNKLSFSSKGLYSDLALSLKPLLSFQSYKQNFWSSFCRPFVFQIQIDKVFFLLWKHFWP